MSGPKRGGTSGSSPARSARTPVPSCASPTSTATASPASRPGPAAGSSRTWSCATADGHGARTGSANAKDTVQRSLPLHGFAQNQLRCELAALAGELIAWASYSPYRARPPAAGNPAACGFACSPWPGASPAAAATLSRLGDLAPG
jgi:hypothetical protein